MLYTLWAQNPFNMFPLVKVFFRWLSFSYYVIQRITDETVCSKNNWHQSSKPDSGRKEPYVLCGFSRWWRQTPATHSSMMLGWIVSWHLCIPLETRLLAYGLYSYQVCTTFLCYLLPARVEAIYHSSNVVALIFFLLHNSFMVMPDAIHSSTITFFSSIA